MSACGQIGRRIAKIRRQNGFTQEYLASLMDRTPQWLSNIEREVRPISAGELAIIAGLMGVDPGVFFADNLNETLKNEATGTTG